MIRAALISITLVVAAVSASPASATSPREVINMDGGPGDRLVIVRDGGVGDGAWWSEGRDVLDYIDATGAHVRVYADHPVSRAEAESRLADADRTASQAQAEARRTAAEGRHAKTVAM